MIELGSFSTRKVRIFGNNPEAPACPLSQAEIYKEIQESAVWAVDHELDSERYYLSESDGDQWYSHRDFQRRMAKIKALETRTPEEREKEIHTRIMREIFRGTQVHELTPGHPITPKPADANKEAA